VPIGRQLAKLMAALKPGDIVTVTKLDRLGRDSCQTDPGSSAQVIRRSFGTDNPLR
jgi:DNA invertase Pin-like site-specific DNA recombinase